MVMAKAFIYVRVSTIDQEYSQVAQAEQAAAYCKAKGLEVAGILTDDGVSGKVSLGNRPAGAELLERLGEVDAIVFAKLDRAFRNTVDAILTVEKLAAAGKTVHFIDLGIDTSTPAGKLCLSMMAALATFERERISERTKEALSVAKQQGVKIGEAPFGYDNVIEFDEHGERTSTGVHVRNEAEWPVVERILRLSRSLSASKIAALLNDEGVSTRDGGRWSHVQVLRIARREQKAA
jgi:site-specific DNA recombinase